LRAPNQTNEVDLRPSGVVTVRSIYSYADSVARILSMLRDRGLKVFAAIDQQAEAVAVGATLVPTTLIIFGNPMAGTALMAARPESGIDLPLKVLVHEAEPGRVNVSFNSAQYIIKRHMLPPELIANLAPAEKLLIAAVSE
jgi:uncharacterized protein (DUF302 family)